MTILGPLGSDIRDAITKGFQQKYPNIAMEFNGGSGSQLAQKLLSERQGGLYTSDLYINGSDTALLSLIPAKAFDPIQPSLVGPDTDPSNWMGGKFDFSDAAGQYNIVVPLVVFEPFAYNPDMVAGGEVKSWFDLLNPKWKGKLAAFDFREGGGPGRSTSTFLYTTPNLGKDYLKQLLGFGVTLTKDNAQLLDWITRGQYAIAISANTNLVIEQAKKGLKIASYPAAKLKEGSYLTGGTSTISVINKAPHPNATKVYLDWLLGHDAQLAWAKASGFASRRLDVPRDFIDPAMLPGEGVPYQPNYKEEYVSKGPEAVEFVKSLIGS